MPKIGLASKVKSVSRLKPNNLRLPTILEPDTNKITANVIINRKKLENKIETLDGVVNKISPSALVDTKSDDFISKESIPSFALPERPVNLELEKENPESPVLPDSPVEAKFESLVQEEAIFRNPILKEDNSKNTVLKETKYETLVLPDSSVETKLESLVQEEIPESTSKSSILLEEDTDSLVLEETRTKSPVLPDGPDGPVETNLDSIVQEKFELESHKCSRSELEVSRSEVNVLEDESFSKFCLFDFGHGYKIKVRRGSGYQAFYDILTIKTNFSECVSILSSGINCSSFDESYRLLNKMMVSKDDVEKEMSIHPVWLKHCREKTFNISEKLKIGDEKAKKLLASHRFDSGIWKGRISEIISVCCGSASASNRNSIKYKEAGIVIQTVPEKRGKHIVMYPLKFRDIVLKCIETVSMQDKDNL